MLDELKNAMQAYSASNSTIIEENDDGDLTSQPSHALLKKHSKEQL